MDFTKPEEIWKAFESGKNYKSTIDLYDTVENNERFYVGDQWHGLNVPDILLIVVNVLKRTVSMLVAKVCSDDIATNIQPFLRARVSEEKTQMMSRQVDKVIELGNLKMLFKRALRNAAVDGDGCIYTYWDSDAPTGQDSRGMIEAELIENINVIFENPYSTNVQGQRHIIIARRLPVEEVRERAKKNGVSAEKLEMIVADEDSHQGEQGDNSKLCTLLTIFYKKDGTVHAVESTEKVIVRNEWDTELKRYPLAWMPWEHQRNSMHGRAALTDMIPNQIAINKAYTGMFRELQRMGFHTLVINKQFIKNWDGRPGKVLEVAGAGDLDVRKYAAYIEGAQSNPSFSNIINELMTNTRDTMGTNDATAGSVRPDNASAIIALQNADTVPLELIRQAYNGFIEDIVRNIVDMMHANYGVRIVEMEGLDENGESEEYETEFDFAELDDENLRVSVDIGAASMWNEITQMDAINSIFTSGIMDDPEKFELYLDVVPNKYLNAKAKMQAWNNKRMAQMQMMQEPYAIEEPYGVEPMEYSDPTIGQEGILNV
jgi:hypothetical protein